MVYYDLVVFLLVIRYVFRIPRRKLQRVRTYGVQLLCLHDFFSSRLDQRGTYTSLNLGLDCFQQLLSLVEVREHHHVHHEVLVSKLEVYVLVFSEHMFRVKPHVNLFALLRLQRELSVRRPGSGPEMDAHWKFERGAYVKSRVIFDNELLLLEGRSELKLVLAQYDNWALAEAREFTLTNLGYVLVLALHDDLTRDCDIIFFDPVFVF